MSFTVVEYIQEDGSNPYREWFDGLDPQAAAKIAAAIVRLEIGNTSRLKRFDRPVRWRHQERPNWRYTAGREIVCGVQEAQSCSCKVQRLEVVDMALTRDFKTTVVERVQRDPAFAKALLDEAATLFLNGEPVTARLILRDLVNATVGFEGLAAETAKPAKSLHRMLSDKGNPSMDNIAAIFKVVRKNLGLAFEAHTVKAA